MGTLEAVIRSIPVLSVMVLHAICWTYATSSGWRIFTSFRDGEPLKADALYHNIREFFLAIVSLVVTGFGLFWMLTSF